MKCPNCFGEGEIANKQPGAKRIYTVFAIYEIDFHRFAESYEARQPAEAEAMALDQHPELIIAGTVEGRIIPVA